MKRLLAVAMLITVLALSEPVLAADLGGIYIAPKFFWSHQMQDNAKTNSGWLSPGGDYSVHHTSDGTWGGALALGYNFKAGFGLPIRAELEYATRSQSKVNTYVQDTNVGWSVANVRKMEVDTLFANVFYDFNTGTSFTPYVGGGLGIANISVKDNFTEGYFGTPWIYIPNRKNVTNFAWNLSAGVAYSFDSHWALDLGYRYSSFGTVKGSGQLDGYMGPGTGYISKAKSDVTSHEMLLGVRYTF